MKRFLFFLFLLPVFCFSVSAVDVMTDVLDLSSSVYNKFGTPPSPANGAFEEQTIDISSLNLHSVPVYVRDFGNSVSGGASYYLEFNYDLSDATSFGLVTSDIGLPSSFLAWEISSNDVAFIPCSGCQVSDTAGNVLREYTGSGLYTIDFDLPESGEVVLFFRFVGSYSFPAGSVVFGGFPRYMTLQTTYESEPDAPTLPGGVPPEFITDLRAVASSVLTVLGNVCSSIVDQPFLLLCGGFLFLGGAVGIIGRLLRRD